MIGKINDSIELVKKGLDIEINLATAEQKEKLADAKLALANLKMNMAELIEENNALNAKLKKKDDYILEKGVWWDKSDIEKDQPFCSACFARGLVIPLQVLWDGRLKDQTPWKCPEKACGAVYNPWGHKEERGRVIKTSRNW